MNRSTHSRGFSLLEMMLVLLIMSALVGIVAFNIAGKAGKAHRQTTIIKMAQIENALDEFYANEASYPTAEQGLIVLQTEGYLKEIPKDAWGSDFYYYYPTQFPDRPYDLLCLGPDRTPNTADDFTNWTMDKEG